MGSVTWSEGWEFDSSKSIILESLAPFADEYDLDIIVASLHGYVPQTILQGVNTSPWSRVVYIRTWCAPLDPTDSRLVGLLSRRSNGTEFRVVGWENEADKTISSVFGIALESRQSNAIPTALRAMHGTPLIDPRSDITYGAVYKNVIYISFDLPRGIHNVAHLINVIMPHALRVVTQTVPELIQSVPTTPFSRFSFCMRVLKNQVERALPEAQAVLKQRQEDVESSERRLKGLKDEATQLKTRALTQEEYDAAVAKISTVRDVAKVETFPTTPIIKVTTKPIYVEFEGNIYKMGRITFDIRLHLSVTQYEGDFIENPVYVHPKKSQGPRVHPHVALVSGTPCMALNDVMWLRLLLIRGEFAVITDYMLRFFKTYTLGGAFTHIERWAVVKGKPAPTSPVGDSRTTTVPVVDVTEVAADDELDEGREPL